MLDRKKTFAITVLFVLAGCAAPPSEDADRSDDEQGSAPPPVFSAEGVSLEESTPDRAQGRFERDGAAIRFTVDRDRAVDRRHLVVSRLSGEQIVESTLVARIDTSRFLGGRLTMVGRNDEEPTKTGDLSVLEELEATPEWKIVPQLKTALGAAGVAEDLISAPRPAETTTGPRVYSAYSSTPWPDNTWYTLFSNESVSFYSWGFWATTVVALRPLAPDNYVSAQISVGPYQSKTWVSGYGEQRYYFQWAGAYVKVTNNRYPLCATYPWWRCTDVREQVLIK